MKRPHLLILGLGLIFSYRQARAQNDCNTATPLSNVSAYCSNVAEFSNAGSTQSTISDPICFSPAYNDIWFSFVATATDVNIRVIGNTSPIAGGTLQRPEVALYHNTCNTADEVRCGSDQFNFGVIEIYQGNLTIGDTYYIRVAGRNSAVGTFELCINNYFPVPQPSGDCETGVVLCNKDPFSVQALVGPGFDPNEVGGSCINSEFSSSWYKWTCDQSGSLTFEISPNNPADDIDFAVYELPNGVDDCNNKQLLRCEAAGENQGQLLSTWIACTGPTGLSLSETDVTEQPGCNGNNNNYVSAINMVAGRSYALVINNFTNSGSGFQITWGGTGTFLGPNANFLFDQTAICSGDPITFTDQSTWLNGVITDWHWTFGPGATPSTANTQGPHTVNYTGIGTRTVVLTIETDAGCFITDYQPVTIGEQPQFSGVVQNLQCYSDANGSVSITQTGGTAPLNYTWSTGSTGPAITNMLPGVYTVTAANIVCSAEETFTITGPPPFDVSYTTTLATCNGGQDGAIFLTVDGATPFPGDTYQINFGSGPSTSESLINVPIGFYPVTITDALGCQDTFTVEVSELELVIDPNLSVVSDPTCFGYNDGFINLVVANGQPAYTYLWNTGTTTANISSLIAGNYAVTLTDANLCHGYIDTLLIDPPLLVITQLDSVDISCFGENDGQAIPTVIGGTYAYSYNWSTSPVQTDSVATQLIPGMVYLTVTDAQGCTATDSTEIIEPPLLEITAVYPQDVRCFGDETGSIAIVATGGTPGYLYSVAATGPFQQDSVVANLPAGIYTAYVQDSQGCMAEWDNIPITQPFELIVDAGPDAFIVLGDTTLLTALVNSANVVSYQWTPNYNLFCDTCKVTEAWPYRTTEYQVLITDINGCTDLDSVTIFVDPRRGLFIPNAFTPNANGLNDTFHPFGGDHIRQVNFMRIYDRWGDYVFENRNFAVNDPAQGWDGTFHGKKMNPGAFVWLIEVEYLDGFKEQYSGDLTLIR